MIKKIGIIGGTGKIGSSFKKKFEKIGYNVSISDETSKDKELEILNTCDWIILTVPIDKTLDNLISKGYKVRYYIPYGPDWYPYSLRRIRENPDIWKDTMKAFFFRSKHRK